MSEWQEIETAPESEITPDGWPVPTRILLWGRGTGVRTGDLFNWRGQLRANIVNLHGDAIESWGVTHWQPLPGPPEGE